MVIFLKYYLIKSRVRYQFKLFTKKFLHGLQEGILVRQKLFECLKNNPIYKKFLIIIFENNTNF